MNLLSPVRRMLPSSRTASGSDARFAELTRGIDDAVKTLRWCRQHLEDRGASDALRLAQLNVSLIAQALEWEMEGRPDKASSALQRIWWSPQVELASLQLERPESGC